MIFVSTEFLIFFVVIYGIYLLFRQFRLWGGAKIVLLVGSLISYGFWYYPYLLILIISISVDFFCGNQIAKTENPNSRKALLSVSILTNLGILGFFKYYNFFIENVTPFISELGVDVNQERLELLLPIGISFYTFQSMTYTLDIYRRKLTPICSFFDFSLYVSFFTQLVAGPIVRAGQFLPQLARQREITAAMIKWGMFLIILGAFKKLVIADNLAFYVDWFFALPSYEEVHSITAWLVMIAYSVQIYSDFSGYTDMAIGMGWLLGFKLPANFYYPYIALGFTDFWRRWHISLSQWIRDYIYIPLGGNQRGETRTLVNVSVTMFLGGLWHGASWLFVVWGLLHGFYLIVDHIILRKYVYPLCQAPGGVSVFISGFTRFLTFMAVVYAWVFFRSQSFDQALQISNVMFTHFAGYTMKGFTYLFMAEYWGIIIVMHLVVLVWMKDGLHRRFSPIIYFPAGVLMLFCLLFFRVSHGNAFIYFAF